MRTTVMFAVLMFALSVFMPGQAWCDKVSESYFPLEEGMRWEYRVTSAGGDAKKLIITNLASREISGKKVTPRQWNLEGKIFIEFMEKDDSGIYRYAQQTGEHGSPTLVTPKECHLKFPINQGDNWHMTTTMDKSTLKLNLSVESVSDEITVPAGTFKDCVTVKQVSENGSGPTILGYEWYAPKVGVVKSMVSIKTMSKEGTVSETRTYQLVSFQP